MVAPDSSRDGKMTFTQEFTQETGMKTRLPLRPRISVLGMLMAGLLATPIVNAAENSDAPATLTATAAPADVQLAPRLTLQEPDADILKDGYVYLPFTVENVTLLPMYPEINGTEVTQLTPRIGHLHVGVDDNAWVWIQTTPAPIYLGPLTPEPHKIRVDLVDAAHNPLVSRVASFVVP